MNKSNENICIILTTTIYSDPKKRYSIVNDSDKRLTIYLESIKQWLEETNLNIVIVENSGYEFLELKKYEGIYKNRLEIILFNEKKLPNYIFLNLGASALNIKSDYLSTSKGTSEMFSIYYACQHSKLIKNSDFVIKITGRYFIPGFEEYIIQNKVTDYDVLRQFNPNRCEIVGCSVHQIDKIFKPNNFRAPNGLYIHHIENLYKERIEQLDQEKVFTCQNFKIKKTLTGYNTECEEL